MAWSPPAHGLLMIRASQEVGAEAARIHLLQGQFCLWSNTEPEASACLINSLAVGLRGQSYIFTVLIAPFDLKARHANAYQLGHLM